MNFYVINGSPRKNNNTGKLLDEAVAGILDKTCDLDAEVNVEIIDLYSLDYKGCMSCFACKRIDGPFYGTCPINDDLKPLLEKLWNADGIIIGTPIYFSNINGETESFLERFRFPKYVYGGGPLLEKSIPMGLIYTMNVDEKLSDKLYKETIYEPLESGLSGLLLKDVYSLKVYDTYQFDDYSKYEKYLFKEEDKAIHQQKQFPRDLKKAYEMGVQIAEDTIKGN